MKVVFLDVDGVLNNRGTRPANPQGLSDWLDPVNVAAANELFERTGAVAVVSSSWREGRSVAELEAAFAAGGLRCRVHDKTPALGPNARVREIQAWLGANDVTAWVALDDDRDIADLGDRAVQVSPLSGLVPALVEQSIAVLTRPTR